MTDHDGHREDESLEAPPNLVAALRELQPERVLVPPYVDDAVLKAARRHLATETQPRFRLFRSRLLWPAAAAACVLLTCLAYLWLGPARQNFALEDINHDGRVDILDAFQLARQLQIGAKPPPGLDLNGDGVVDRRDAEVIAIHAVKLEKGGRS